MGAIIKETKYLLFEDITDSKKRKTKVVKVINKHQGSLLATIEWYGAWRQYCFFPTMEFDTVWNTTCLGDIVNVITALMHERKIDKNE